VLEIVRLGGGAQLPDPVAQGDVGDLVSVLARPGEKPLIADFDGQGKDFIADINPEGGKESTGLVTRFSLTRQAHPPGFPVCLRLLSEADVIKIIANTFFLDGDLTEEAVPSPEDIEAALRAARAAAGGGVPGLSEDEVYDIQEYVEKHFRGSEQARALQPFWEEAAQLAPRLQPADRGALLAILWGGHEPFARLWRVVAVPLRRAAGVEAHQAEHDVVRGRLDHLGQRLPGDLDPVDLGRVVDRALEGLALE